MWCEVVFSKVMNFLEGSKFDTKIKALALAKPSKCIEIFSSKKQLMSLNMIEKNRKCM